MSLRSYMSNVLLSPQLHHEVSGSGDVAEEDGPKNTRRDKLLRAPQLLRHHLGTALDATSRAPDVAAHRSLATKHYSLA
jgi:hypothetical protein